MCGIVGYIGKRQAAPILLEGLHRLEYLGYDSAGIAVGNKGKLRVAKRKGRVRELAALEPQKFRGVQGIAHTRWATHGEPSDRNAHPHSDASGRYAVVTAASSRMRGAQGAARRRAASLHVGHRHRGAGAPDRAARRRLAARDVVAGRCAASSAPMAWR